MFYSSFCDITIILIIDQHYFQRFSYCKVIRLYHTNGFRTYCAGLLINTPPIIVSVRVANWHFYCQIGQFDIF